MKNWTLEDNVNDWIKDEFKRIGQTQYKVESAMSDYMKDALKQGLAIKRLNQEGGKAWKPDFHIEGFHIPVIIESKLKEAKIANKDGDKIKLDEKSVQNYAVNGAIHYAQCAILSKKYTEAIAIGIAGDNEENVSVEVYYVFGGAGESYKHMPDYISLHFLENQETFDYFYEDTILTEAEKHAILINSREALQAHAKALNKLMHNLAITAPQRVLYVSGMLLSMQDINSIDKGLNIEDLIGSSSDNKRDGIIIVNQIETYLKNKAIPENKVKLILSSFQEISKDADRDRKKTLDKAVSKLLQDDASVNKQIFTYIYENIFLSIDAMSGHLDIMGEMYSEFLKYALGDGKEIGIVLTPPYVTKMMAEILGVQKDSKVMDLATGSAGFLISCMELMIEDAKNTYTKNSTDAKEAIAKIKKDQLLGVELNAEMYTLASTNMILRGDGSSNIKKGSSFEGLEEVYKAFNADILLLNPPFSHPENGMPFLKLGLKHMRIGGKAAIIIQDSAGSGKGTTSCKAILKQNQLIASIKMPTDLFMPMAGVQTSIYIVEHTGKEHDESKKVTFIDFRNDGYKRTKRGLYEIDNPMQRYNDIVDIYKNGKEADVSSELWNLEKQVVKDKITLNGNDWNFEKHQKIDTKPTLADFKKTVAHYMAWEVDSLLNKEGDCLGEQ